MGSMMDTKEILPKIISDDIEISDRARYIIARQLVGEILIELAQYRVLRDKLVEMRSNPTEETYKAVEDQLNRVLSLGDTKRGDVDEGKPLLEHKLLPSEELRRIKNDIPQ
jgi:hypothetical protein